MENINQLVPYNIELSPDKISVFQNSSFPLTVFDERCINFLNKLSQTILKDPVLKNDPGIVALGFWLRKSNIQKIIKENEYLLTNNSFKTSPIGIVFHICPSNVDTMFLYSLALSLLMGNKNILRISSKSDLSNVNLLYFKISELVQSDEFQLFAYYISIVSYGHIDNINIFLSNQSHARVIWGGDSTVKLFKSYQVKPRIKDILFPNRKSFALFKLDPYFGLSDNQKQELARKFYNDTYSFDQKGCSSAQVIFLLGDKDQFQNFKIEFHSILSSYVKYNYKNDITSLASLKYNHLVSDIIDHNNSLEKIFIPDNYVYFIEINENEAYSESCGGGYFYLYNLKSLEKLISFINWDVQTLSYFGLDDNEINEIYQLSYAKGIDRIVPIGNALDFNYIWDGYNILDELCVKKNL
jgi:hypothetical protein